MALTFRIVTSGNRAAVRMNTSTDPSFFTFDEVVKFDSPVKACWAAISSFNFQIRNRYTDTIGYRFVPLPSCPCNSFSMMLLQLSYASPLPFASCFLI